MLDETRYLVVPGQVFILQFLQIALNEITNFVAIGLGLLRVGVADSGFTHCVRHPGLVTVGNGFPRTKSELKRCSKRKLSSASLNTLVVEVGVV
jgi:hypothetical protein